MVREATPETFSSLVADGTVLIDFWGPRCQPCLRLMPEVVALAEARQRDVELVKVEAPANRSVCRDVGVMTLPTYLVFHNGAERRRLTGDPTAADIAQAVDSVLEEVRNEHQR